MRFIHHRARLSVLVMFALAATSAPALCAEEAASTKRLTLERLYSLPSLIGTAPRGFSWSPDSRRLTFLWNDSGSNFRDVWWVDLDGESLAPRRLTQLPHLESSPASDDPAVAAANVERLERDSGVAAVVWHPDGERLMLSFRGDLWMMTVGGEPWRLTETEAAEVGVSVSPDGESVAFLRGGDLWTLSLETSGAAARQLTHLASSGEAGADRAADSSIALTGFEWSPDGSRIALLETDASGVTVRGIPDYLAEETTLTMRRRAYPGEESERQRLGVLDVASNAIEWLVWPESAPDILLSYHWSPDGRHLALDTSDLYAKDRGVFVVDLEGEQALEPRLLTRDLDPLNETFYFWRIAWAADSQAVYFLSDRSEDYHVYSVAISGEDEVRRLTRGRWAVASLHPVAGGVVVVGNRRKNEERHLFRIDDAEGKAVRLSRRSGTHAPVVSPDGTYAAVAFSSDDTPPDLLLTALDGSASEQVLTHSPRAEFANYHWVTPRYVEFKSHRDGSRLHGRLTLPPDWEPGREYPAIVGSVYTDSVRNQWGGRTAHPTWGLDQFLAQEGYVLLNVDMRGSWGRGREHRRGIRLDYGGMDIEDLESGVRFLSRLGYVDKDRVGIWGSSYGGLMTAMSLFRKPGLYAAGVAGAPATNVRHALTGQMAVMMRPEDQPEEYDDSSPYLHAQGLEDPLMIIHGMRDQVVLFKDSVALTQRLIQLDKDVELVALPNAGHGWDNEGLAQTRFAFRRLFAHFERHLKTDGPH